MPLTLHFTPFHWCRQPLRRHFDIAPFRRAVPIFAISMIRRFWHFRHFLSFLRLSRLPPPISRYATFIQIQFALGLSPLIHIEWIHYDHMPLLHTLCHWAMPFSCFLALFYISCHIAFELTPWYSPLMTLIIYRVHWYYFITFSLTHYWHWY